MLDVYPLCLGTNTFGWTSTPGESFAVLDEYVEAGGNFIDSADSYSAWASGNSGGESELIIGQWLAKGADRSNIVIATKVGKAPGRTGLSAGTIKDAVEDSLRRLGTDYIDLYYAHAEDLDVPVEESVAAFTELVDEGKIRYVGLSNHSPERIRQWMEIAPAKAKPVALQPHYNLVCRQDFEEKLLPLAKEYDLAVMPYFSLAAGLLTGKYQGKGLEGERAGMVGAYQGNGVAKSVDALIEIAHSHNVEPAAIAIAWLLAQDTVTAPIASARVPSQLPPLLEGVTIVLSSEENTRLDEVSRGL